MPHLLDGYPEDLPTELWIVLRARLSNDQRMAAATNGWRPRLCELQLAWMKYKRPFGAFTHGSARASLGLYVRRDHRLFWCWERPFCGQFRVYSPYGLAVISQTDR